MHGTFTDTGHGYLPAPHLPPLNPNGEKALRIREACLDTEIVAGALYHEHLCQQADKAFERLCHDVRSRHQIREILFLRGRG
jgi:hypothetical protein